MKSIFVLFLSGIAFASSQRVVPLITCEDAGCPEACLSDPTRCVTKCNDTIICPEGQDCRDGYCEDIQVLTCANALCSPGTECLEDPVRCLQPCNKCVKCPKDRVCINGYCEEKPKLTCSTVDCRDGYACLNNPVRCLKICSDAEPCPEGEGKICSNGYCKDSSETCAVVRCSSGYRCFEEPLRCVKECKSNRDCPRGTICCEGFCEKSPIIVPIDV